MALYDQILDVSAFARAFGAPPAEVEAVLGDRIRNAGLRYRRLSQRERDAILLDIAKRLESGQFTQVGEQRRDLWAQVWQEHYDAYLTSGHDERVLIPTFVGRSPIVRIDGDFAEAESAAFEPEYFAIVRHWLFHRWLSGLGQAYEFGCGSAFNLAALARQRPDMRLMGLDWAPASVRLVDSLASGMGLAMSGRLFDFFHPDEDFDLPEGTAAMTFCALEQIGDRFPPVIDYLLRKRPALVLHMEPVLDFYDGDNLVDWLAIRYHTHRHFLNGLLGHLRQLEAAGRIELMEARRLGFGSLYHEGYSVLAWQPL